LEAALQDREASAMKSLKALKKTIDTVKATPKDDEAIETLELDLQEITRKQATLTSILRSSAAGANA
jgi:hypothetical protein